MMANLLVLLLPLFASFGYVDGQIYLANFTSVNTPSTFSSTCVSVLNQQVNCSPYLNYVGLDNSFYSNATLSALCTSTCSSALSTYLRRVEGACAGIYYNSPNGYSYLAAYNAELVWERYETVCLANSNGQFCSPLLASVAGVNPQNQQSTASPQPSFLCNTCVLSALQTSLELPLASNSEIASSFTSVTSSCRVTGLSIKAPSSTAWVVKNTATSTVSSATSSPTRCAGTMYTVSGKQTCNAVSQSQGISTVNLLASNNLQAFCTNFPTSGSVCIPTALKCKPCVVKTGDTCTTIAAASNATWTQIVSWNPFLGQYCQNVATYVGYVACASNPGGTWVNPYLSTTTTFTFSDTIFTLSMTPIPNALTTPIVANATSTASVNSSSLAPPGPVASGTRLDCDVLFQAPVLTNFSSGATSLSCADAAAAYNVSLADFETWNPSLSSSSCTMKAGIQFCGQLTLQTAPGTTSYCAQYATAPPGWACQNFTASYGIEQDYFGAWNPGVGSACNNWQTGVQYCVAVKHFRQTGIISTCNQFAMANDTDWLDMPCQIIETKFGLSHARFVAWNPAVLSNCTGLVRNYDYCVSIPGYHPTYTTTSSATTWINTWSWMTASPSSGTHAATVSTTTGKTSSTSHTSSSSSRTSSTTSSTAHSSTTSHSTSSTKTK